MGETGIRYATEESLEKTNEKLDQTNRDVSDVKLEVAKLYTMFDGFKDLPATMNNLDKTLVGIQGQLSTMNEKINSQGNDIKAQKERGKIDIVEWISKNWWGIVFAAATIFMIIKDYAA